MPSPRSLLLRAYRATLATGRRAIGVWKTEQRAADNLHDRGYACVWRDPGLRDSLTLTHRGRVVAERLHRLGARR